MKRVNFFKKQKQTYTEYRFIVTNRERKGDE